MEMPRRRFYAANVAAAMVWAPLHIVPAALLGASISQGDVKVMALAAVFAMVLAFIVYRVHAFLRRSHAQSINAKSPRKPIVLPPPQPSKGRD
jgi:membrane protein DedA with SNARE-associated domain